MIMKSIDPQVAQRIRDRKVLCILIGHEELTSNLPQFTTDKTGEELDFYNWRQRGFLSWKDGRPTVVFAEEDVLEYEDGMQLESILIHEFGHVIHGAGFDKALQDRLTDAYRRAKEKGLWNDGRAAQRFRRVKSDTPVSLLDALVAAFPDESPGLLKACLNGGDILVGGKPTDSKVKVTKDDKVLIVFGGPKECYAGKNRSEYWAEGVQDWYDTNRTMDHDHNHIHTREQLKEYDPGLAKLCEDVLGDSPWRFVSPRDRAGKGHLKGYDPAAAPTAEDPEHIKEAANDYYDEYWKDYWQRLRDKHAAAVPQEDGEAKDSEKGFLPLFNGKDLTGWVKEGKAGFEVQIEDIPDSNDPTGSIYGRVRAERMPFQPGEWVLIQVFLKENHCAVRVNGVTVAESHEMGRARSGNIALQMHAGNGWIRRRDMRVRPLPPATGTPAGD